MKLFARVAVAALLVYTVAGQAGAQIQIPEENTNVGTSSAEFLLLGAGARGMALGGGFGALTRDVEALYYNPAGLPLMDGPQTMLTIMPYFADTDYFWAGVAFPFASGQYAIGISLGNFGFSDQPIFTEQDPDGLSGLTYDVSETFVGLSFAHAFIDRFTGGVTLKFIVDDLGDSSANAAAVDIGTNFHTEFAGRPIAMAVTIQNLGSELEHSGTGLEFTAFPGDPQSPAANVDPSPAEFRTQSFPLPVVFRASVAYDVISTEASRLSFISEFNESNNNDTAWGFAGEYEWAGPDSPVSAAVRASYSFQPDNVLSDQENIAFAGKTPGDDTGLDGLVLGGGLKYELSRYELRLDYAFRHFGVLGTQDVFTLGFAWR